MEFTNTSKAFQEAIDTYLGAYGGKLTTITCYMETDMSIKLQDILDNQDLVLEVLDTVSAEIRVPGTQKSKKRCHRSFHNSLAIQYKVEKRTICTKLFRNGMHITGCKSFEQCHDTFDKMSRVIYFLYNQVPQLTAFKLQLVNVLVDVGHELYLNELCERFNRDGYKCLYDREVYCGLRIKVPCEGCVCTVLAFPSGKILLTGLKHPDCIKDIYTKIIQSLA